MWVEKHGCSEIIKEVIKCKGLLNRDMKNDIMNFENMKRLVFEEATNDTETIAIVRKKPFCVETDTLKKRFQFTFTKRVALNNLDTYPFGHIALDGVH